MNCTVHTLVTAYSGYIDLTRLTRYSFFSTSLSLSLVRSGSWNMTQDLFSRLNEQVSIEHRGLQQHGQCLSSPFLCYFYAWKTMWICSFVYSLLFQCCCCFCCKIHCYTELCVTPRFSLASQMIINLETKVNGNIWFISWNWSEKKSLSFNPKLNFRFFSTKKIK